MSVSEITLRLSEAEFQAMIVYRARALGWLVHHDRGDYRQCIAGDPGFPDLLLARNGVVMLWEVKSEEGRVSDAQVAWLDALSGSEKVLDASVCDHVLATAVWPRDWDWIQEKLA